MKELVFIQKQGLTAYRFVLKEETIHIRVASLREKREWCVRLVDVGHQTVIKKDSKWLGLGLSLFFGFFSVLFVVVNVIDHSAHLKTWLWVAISLFYALASIFILITPVTNEIRLVGGNEALALISDRPSEVLVREFIGEIIRRSGKVLRNKYGTVDPDLPEEVMLGQLHWLLETEIISREEHERLKGEYFRLKQGEDGV